MAQKIKTLYSQSYSYTVGTDMTTKSHTWYQYAAEVGSYETIVGGYGEIKATSANWAGGFEVDNGGSWDTETIEFDVIGYAGGRSIYGFRSHAAGAYWIQHLPAANVLRLYVGSRNFLTGLTQIADWDSVAPGSASSVKVTVENVSGDVKITVYIDGTYIAEYTDSTYQYTSGSFIVSGYQTGWQLDNLDIYEYYTRTYTTEEYVKRSSLQVECEAEFKLNLGTTLDAAVDITKYVLNLSDITEKLSKSNVNTGGVILPNLKIQLDNSRGIWNKLGEKFKNGFVNNSSVKISTRYISPDDEDIGDDFVFEGLLKYPTCSWNRVRHIFEATLSPASSLIATEKVPDGILSSATTPQFSDVIFKILNRQPFTKYLTISAGNIDLGWDVDIDQFSDIHGKIVKTVLDNIMLLTGSIYYVNYDQEFIVEPITPTSPTAIYSFRGEDIFSIKSEKYDWESHYTGVKWDDSTNTVQRVEMNYPDRELYQYDYNELNLAFKYVTDSTNRSTVLTNLLSMYKYLKREVVLECKWNPEVIVNKYITLDVPEEAVIDTRFMVWNEDNWNAGKFWGIASPGISFSSSELWRVVEIKRSSEGYKMQLKIVQLYSNDEV